MQTLTPNMVKTFITTYVQEAETGNTKGMEYITRNCLNVTGTNTYIENSLTKLVEEHTTNQHAAYTKRLNSMVTRITNAAANSTPLRGLVI